MWEISLNIKRENENLANILYKSLLNAILSLDGIITINEDNGYISILVGVNEENKEKAKLAISSCIIELICTSFKMTFLDNYLVFPRHDKIGMLAFKKALLNFDKETDKFIIKKNLDLSRDLFLESFYHFKLKSLQEKWSELVSLSNENSDYLLSSDSFIDLLKFLVDNLDICEDEISVVKEDEGYKIFTLEEGQYQNKVFNEESIVSSVIDLSPQKINLYFNETSSAINLLEKIFEERITVNNLGGKKNYGSISTIYKSWKIFKISWQYFYEMLLL